MDPFHGALAKDCSLEVVANSGSSDEEEPPAQTEVIDWTGMLLTVFGLRPPEPHIHLAGVYSASSTVHETISLSSISPGGAKRLSEPGDNY